VFDTGGFHVDGEVVEIVEEDEDVNSGASSRDICFGIEYNFQFF
jgi:hypothetical protein